MKIYVAAVEALRKKRKERCEDGDELVTKKIHGFLTPLGKRKKRGSRQDELSLSQKLNGNALFFEQV
jgi:hypothetical protein